MTHLSACKSDFWVLEAVTIGLLAESFALRPFSTLPLLISLAVEKGKAHRQDPGHPRAGRPWAMWLYNLYIHLYSGVDELGTIVA